MDEMSPQELKAASWLHQRRALLKRLGYGLAITADAILVLIMLVQLVRYIVGIQTAEQAYRTIGDTQVNYSVIEAAKSLRMIDKGVVPQFSDVYDTYAVIQNQNDQYVARFSYLFSYAGQTIEVNDGYVLPNSNQILIVSGFKNPSAGGTLTSQIKEVAWERIKGSRPEVNFVLSNQELKRVVVPIRSVDANTNSSDLTGASTVLNANENMNVNSSTNTNDEFFRPEDATSEEAVDTSEYTVVTADIFNNSAYGFRTVQVVVMLTNSQGTIVGVARRILRDVQSLSTTPIEITWQKPFAIDVTPEIVVTTDYFAEENLILPGEE